MPDNCHSCTDKTCLASGKPCKDIENILAKHGIRSRNYLRPRVSTHRSNIDKLGKWKEVDVPDIESLILSDPERPKTAEKAFRYLHSLFPIEFK